MRVWKAWLTGSRNAWKPSPAKTSMAFCTAAVSPPITACELLLMLAATTYPSTDRSVFSTTASGAITAAIHPLSPRLTRVISRPRAAAASRACAKGMMPAATSAPYSPSEWPMTMSGRMPKSANSRCIASSSVSTAGWQIAVCCSEASALA